MKTINSVILLIICAIICCASKVVAKENNFAKLRHRMVDQQLTPRGISDKLVISAMLKVPRHEFVPKNFIEYAYRDSALPIEENQTISQPYIVALMTQLLDLKGQEKVLEIGTGSGYQSAVLAEIAKEVYTIEILKPLADSAKRRLENMGYKNIKVLCGDGYLGWPQFAPFDAIMVTAAATQIPQPLIGQLKIGGRLVIPLGNIEQQLFLVIKEKDAIVKKRIIPVIFVPMTGKIQNE